MSHRGPAHAKISEHLADQRVITNNVELHLSGKATSHIWLMEDGDEPHVIGLRLDSGDSGVVYFTRKQAQDLAEQLLMFCQDEPDPKEQ